MIPCFVYSKCLYRVDSEKRRFKRDDLTYWLLAVLVTLIFPLWMIVGWFYVSWAKAYWAIEGCCSTTSCIVQPFKMLLVFLFGLCLFLVPGLFVMEATLFSVLFGAPGWYYFLRRLPIEYQ